MADIDWFIKEGEKNVSAAEIMVDALAQLNTSVFDELVRLSGPEAARTAVKPYRIINAKSCVMVQERS